ncbi:helix-turn-helix transcriptional regulator [Mucilaginibacter sp. CSA2-8R]|uniref:helix-turn-helix domain-containing protein n=1 Tax=Mucilaginibacter sp. CSA2-8R TaxID=3141542 RepID=UPI00315D440F
MPRLKTSSIKSFDKYRLGENLRLIRSQKGFTQIDLAVKLKISQNAYSKIELGQTQFTIEMLMIISELLEVDVGELVIALLS